MAARHKREVHHNPDTIERLRELINARLIINTLSEHVNSGKEMAPSRITAGLGLLKKIIPDQAAITHSGDKDNPIEHKHDIEIRPQLSRAEWEKRHVLKK